ncbi:MAG: PaaI family thioesterase [Desulfobacteraceae bacterium]|nr:PaaI family thioesterase [Desulfobacteraceae bacterium]
MPEYEELSASFKKAVFEKTRKQIPYWNLLGLELMDLKKGWARLKLPYTGKLANAGGVAHGGAVFSAADSAVGVALLGMTEKNESISTIEMKINYIKTFSTGYILVEATIIHKGRNTALGEAHITDDNGKLIAKATATYAVIPQA